MNLFLSAVWLVAAVVLFAWWQTEPDNVYNKIPMSAIPAYWFAGVMVVYNLFRWWSVRQMNRTRYTRPRLPPRRPIVRYEDEQPHDRGDRFPPLTD